MLLLSKKEGRQDLPAAPLSFCHQSLALLLATPVPLFGVKCDIHLRVSRPLNMSVTENVVSSFHVLRHPVRPRVRSSPDRIKSCPLATVWVPREAMPTLDFHISAGLSGVPEENVFGRSAYVGKPRRWTKVNPVVGNPVVVGEACIVVPSSTRVNCCVARWACPNLVIASIGGAD
jgi:hypothetical protein